MIARRSGRFLRSLWPATEDDWDDVVVWAFLGLLSGLFLILLYWMAT